MLKLSITRDELLAAPGMSVTLHSIHLHKCSVLTLVSTVDSLTPFYPGNESINVTWGSPILSVGQTATGFDFTGYEGQKAGLFGYATGTVSLSDLASECRVTVSLNPFYGPGPETQPNYTVNVYVGTL